MYEKLESCPSCSHSKFDNYLICKDHSVSKEHFALVKCAKCELLFTNPRPSEKELHKYYESEEYISHTDKGTSIINFLYKIVRHYTLNKKRKLIEKLSPIGTVLDYGCGTGDFIKKCKKKEWQVSGVEPNERARKIALQKTGKSIHQDLSEIHKEEKFDVITSWHVIEHISELKETLKKLRKKIKKEGLLIVAVPNANAYDATWYKEFWAAYDVPRHLYHFTPKSFSKLARETNLKIINTIPMTFDAYYVSLLSEAYKSGKNSFINGMLSGLKSNKLAQKSENYSSLIYILKK